MKKVQAVSLIVGLALFAYLVHKVGLGNIVGSIRAAGLGILALILVAGVRHLLRTLAWMRCFDEAHGRVRLWELFNVRMAGEAIRFVSFTGPLLSEPSKAALLRRRLPMAHSFSSLFVENLTYSLGAVVVTLGGLTLLFANYTISRHVMWAGTVVALCAVASVVLVQRAIARRSFPLLRLTNAVGRLTGREGIRRRAAGVESMEAGIYDFYHRRKGAFFAVLALELAAHLTNILEVYIALLALGVEATLLAAFIIEAAAKVINSAFFFVPGQVGVYEGGNALLLKALGFGMATGVALALIEKIRTLAWTAYGLLALALAFRRNAERNSAGGREAVAEAPKELCHD